MEVGDAVVDEIPELLGRLGSRIPFELLGLPETAYTRLLHLLFSGKIHSRSLSHQGDEALALGLLLCFPKKSPERGIAD